MSKGELAAEKAAAICGWRVGEASSKHRKISWESSIAAFTSKRNLNSADPLNLTDGHWALLQPSLVLARGSFMGVIIIQ